MSSFNMSNGMTAAELFSQSSGWTFDDITMLPPHSGVSKGEVVLSSGCKDGFLLNLPIMSSPMDTVTEWQLSIEMALHGGIGIIHMNLPVEDAIEHVLRVKRYQMGIINDPVCRKPTDPVSSLEEVKRRFGFSTILITEDGTKATKLLGMVTKGHVALEPNKSTSFQQVMIPRRSIMTVPEQEVRSWSDARAFLRSHPEAHKLPILNNDESIFGFITRKDVEKMALCPHALCDPGTGQLRVGAAISTHERDDQRVVELLKVGIDVIVVDSAQGGTDHAVRRIEQIRSLSQEIPIIAGNVVTPAQAESLVRAGASGLRVGMGSGSICTTQEVLGIGRAQLSAIHHISEYVRTQGRNIVVIADGGIRNSGDIMKALVCGASVVMVGRLIAGCDETPSVIEEHNGRRFKRYRGMGSIGAINQGGKYRYSNSTTGATVIPQGVEGLVPASGPLRGILDPIRLTLQTGFEYLGCTSIEMLHQRVQSGDIRFEVRSPAARTEGKPHDIVEA